MSILLLLIPLSLMLLLVMIAAFIWAVRNGQFEDLDTPPLAMLTEGLPDAARPAAQPEEGRR